MVLLLLDHPVAIEYFTCACQKLILKTKHSQLPKMLTQEQVGINQTGINVWMLQEVFNKKLAKAYPQRQQPDFGKFTGFTTILAKCRDTCHLYQQITI